MRHKNGLVTDKPVTLDDVVSDAHKPEQADDRGDGESDRCVNGDPVSENFWSSVCTNARTQNSVWIPQDI